MDPIQAAIDEIESQEPGEKFTYTEIATKYGVDRSTLSRRHRGVTASRAATADNQQKLNPQQEQELVRYIKGLTERHIPPTREMIRNLRQ
jgi:transposase-like protein